MSVAWGACWLEARCFFKSQLSESDDVSVRESAKENPTSASENLQGLHKPQEEKQPLQKLKFYSIDMALDGKWSQWKRGFYITQILFFEDFQPTDNRKN